MDLIYTDKNLVDLNFFNSRTSVDIENGLYSSDSRNDFEITIPTDAWDRNFNEGSIFYDAEGGEVGGRVQGLKNNTSTNKITVCGYTWRGLISKKYIEPANGQAYYLARGDANKFLRDILDNTFDGLIIGNAEDCGVEVNRDLRYTNMLEAIEKTLADKKLRLKITVKCNDDQSKKVICSAVPINNKSETTEFNEDYGYSLIAQDIKNGYNHCICLGQGELTERTVIHLFLLSNGEITTDQSRAIADGIAGLNERTMVYDYPSVETEDELISGGIDQLKQNSDTKSLQISNVDDVEIGDIVGARDRITNIYMQKQIIAKVISGNVDRLKIQNKVGD